MSPDPRYTLCMSIGVAELWWEANRRTQKSLVGDGKSPCEDCCEAWALARRALQFCDGHYPGEQESTPLPPSRSRVYATVYATEEERIAARRRTWRDASQARRMAKAAAA